MSRLAPTEFEVMQRDRVLERIRLAVQSSRTIKLPPYNSAQECAGSDSALIALVNVENDFGGQVGGYGYQFEGEEDLLHLFVVRCDKSPLTVEESQSVLDFLLPDLPRALLWLKPGELSQHYYFGHDLLLELFEQI